MLQHRAVKDVSQAGLEMSCSGRRLQYVSSLLRTTSQCFSRMTRSIVKVPVLSVQRISIAPRFWMEFSRLTMTFFLRHRERAFGEADSHDHRQHFRSESHRNREREKERLAPVMLAETVDEENQRHHHGHEPDISQVNPDMPLSKLVGAGGRRWRWPCFRIGPASGLHDLRLQCRFQRWFPGNRCF